MIEVFVKYSDVDKRYDYCIVCKDVPTYWANWLWFFLGSHFKGLNNNPYHLYPFRTMGAKRLKKYKWGDSRRTAQLIYNAIKKHHSQYQ